MADAATVGALRQAIHEKLNIPLEDIVLSKDPALVGHRSVAAAAARGAQRLQPLLACRQAQRPLAPPRRTARPPAPAQLTSKDVGSFRDLADPRGALQALGVRHGDVVGAAAAGQASPDSSGTLAVHVVN